MARRTWPVGIGIVGMGFMGLTHLRATRALRSARVVAMVTADPRKARGDFSSVKGNFGSAGAREKLEGIRVYPTLDEMLSDESVELVDICLPSYLHAKAATRAMKGGKSVLVEKPIALKEADSRRMLAASESSGKLLMVAQVLKFMPEFSALAEAVEKGRYGRLLGLHLRRIIAMPDWGDDSWFSDPKLSGGMVIDLHIHDTDFAVHLFGKPKAVTSQGIVSNRRVEAIRTAYHFGRRSPLVTSEAGWINAPALPFEHGYDAYFDKATIQFNSTSRPRPTVYSSGKPKDLRLPRGDGFARELEAAAESVRRGKVHPLLSARSAATSLAVCRAEEKSAIRGSKVEL